jgi:hypothetical protein
MMSWWYKIVLGTEDGIIYEINSFDYGKFKHYDTENKSPIINFIEEKDKIFALHKNGKVT